jgi:hypothetical protein
LSRVKENHDRELELANDLRLKKDKLVFFMLNFMRILSS